MNHNFFQPWMRVVSPTVVQGEIFFSNFFFQNVFRPTAEKIRRVYWPSEFHCFNFRGSRWWADIDDCHVESNFGQNSNDPQKLGGWRRKFLRKYTFFGNVTKAPHNALPMPPSRTTHFPKNFGVGVNFGSLAPIPKNLVVRITLPWEAGPQWEQTDNWAEKEVCQIWVWKCEKPPLRL